MPWFWPVSIPNPLRILMFITACQFLDAASKGKGALDLTSGDGSTKVDSSFLKRNPDEVEDKSLSSHEQRLVPMSRVERTMGRYPGWYHHFEPNSLPELPYLPICSDPNIPCRNLSAQCLTCDLHDQSTYNCTYGEPALYTCETKPNVRCKGDPSFDFVAKCRFCYQTEVDEHSCTSPTNCKVAGDAWKRVRKNCTANHDVICLGNRRFHKSDMCNYSSGHRWSMALLLSVTLGGFGGDRFYLGHWQEGVGKLFSFGGLGVWTVVDIVLIAIGYLRPRDGSLYIDYDL